MGEPLAAVFAFPPMYLAASAMSAAVSLPAGYAGRVFVRVTAAAPVVATAATRAPADSSVAAVRTAPRLRILKFIWNPPKVLSGGNVSFPKARRTYHGPIRRSTSPPVPAG